MNFFPSSEPNLTWSNDPVFGLVHRTGCETCMLYMNHIVAANQSTEDPPFNDALRDQEAWMDTHFLNRACAADRLRREFNQPDLIEELAEYSDRQDDVLERTRTWSTELISARTELRVLRKQYNTLLQLVDTLTRADLADSSTESDSNDDTYTRTRRGHATPGDAPSDLSTAGIVSRSHPRTPPNSERLRNVELPTPPPSPEKSYRTVSIPRFLSQVPPAQLPSLVLDNDRIASDFPERESFDLCPCDCVSPLHDAIETPKFPLLAGFPSISPPPFHSTSVPQREDSQPFLEPLCDAQSMGGGMHPAPQPSVRTKQPKYEIFVDASGWGIGFFLNGRWLAWQLKPGWDTAGRNNQWAEMVAVELGLRVAISAGVHSTTIIIRSDNMGVIRALETGNEKHDQRKEVLDTILDIARSSDITILPNWVSTKLNLADKPSRGEFSSKTLLFPTQLLVPFHLSELIYPPIDSDVLV